MSEEMCYYCNDISNYCQDVTIAEQSLRMVAPAWVCADCRIHLVECSCGNLFMPSFDGQKQCFQCGGLEPAED